MIEGLVPTVVAAVTTVRDLPDAALYPEEEALVSRAVAKRRQEFATVRHCARRALGRLGVPPGPIMRAEQGAPRWPERTIGSMTHCVGYRAAAVAWQDDILALGIDAEPHEALPGQVLEDVTVGSELPTPTRGSTGTGCCSAPRSRCTRLGTP